MTAAAPPPNYDEAVSGRFQTDNTTELSTSCHAHRPEARLLTEDRTHHVVDTQIDPPAYDSLFITEDDPPGTQRTVSEPSTQSEAPLFIAAEQYEAPARNTSRLDQACQKLGCESISKRKFCVTYSIVGYIFALPACIAMIAIAYPNSSKFDSTAQTTPTVHFDSTKTTSTVQSNLTYNITHRCAAYKTLPSCMLISGTVGILVWIAILITVVCKGAIISDNAIANTKRIFFWLVLGLVMFFAYGFSDSLKVWFGRPDCDPFTEVRCPSWYCDNTLMVFSMIFYSSSVVLLLPLWCLIVLFLLVKLSRKTGWKCLEFILVYDVV